MGGGGLKSEESREDSLSCREQIDPMCCRRRRIELDLGIGIERRVVAGVRFLLAE